MYQDIVYSVDERVAIIALNRGASRNALSERMVDEFIDAVARADADEAVRVLVVTGGPEVFSSGYDIKESGEKPKRSARQWHQRMQKDNRFTYSVWDCSKPVIAEINGYCLAGALELAMCCDMRYCADDARFAVTEARFASGVATMIMPWIIGARARALVYSGDTFDADKALRIGLVDDVFAKDALRGEVLKLARRISQVSLEYLRTNKRIINRTFEMMGLRHAIEYGAEAAAMMNTIGSPEAEAFDRIKREQGLSAALKWRAAGFAQYE
ncbi:enoyl-CoA hydratase/isomerase family protein [Orrella sp. JC864]|uniref:enoyl-CoA hydratase/isomerase family protein n=1 Tax=Orrella sp. JC864 TaxID=3120298 RepID=UPI003009056D